MSFRSTFVYSLLGNSTGGKPKNGGEDDLGSNPYQRSLWHPFVLTLWPSLIFSLILIGAVAGLEAFVRQSDLHSGFPAPSTTSQNLVTYVPVAFVIVVGWVWQAYEVEVKKIVPWASMSTGPIPASDSILLDYVGANPLVAITTATCKRHYSILVCNAAALAVAVCSIVAASIWDIDPTLRVLPVTLQRTGTYNGSRLDNATDTAQYLSQYLARTVLQLPGPSWLTDAYVIAPFNISEAESGMVLSGTTQAYNASLTCEDAKVLLSNNGTNITITYAGVSQMIPCDVFNDDPGNWTYDPRPYLYTGKVYNWTVGSETSAMLLTTRLLSPNNCVAATAVSCVPSYTAVDVQVSVDAETAAFNKTTYAVSATSTVTYPGGSYFLQTVDNNNGVTGSPWVASGETYADNDDPFAYIPWTTSPPNVSEVGNYSPWFHLLQHLLFLSPEQLVDSQTLIHGSQKIFSDIWLNVIQPTNTSDPFRGIAAVTDKRLVTRVGSIRAIQVCLCVVAVISFAFVFWRPRAFLPCDPSSLAPVALVLAQSTALECKLDGLGVASQNILDVRLSDAKYRLSCTVNGAVGIATIPNVKEGADLWESQPEPEDAESRAIPHWSPSILHPIAKYALGGIILTLIAVLEALVQLNSRRDGLADFNGSRAERYAWSYTGPVILFLLGVGIGMFDSGVRAIHPFIILRRTAQPGDRLGYDPLHQSMITLPFHAIRHRQPVVLISTLSVLLLLAAKTAVAGLFTINNTMRVTNVQVSLNTTFAWNATSLANTMVNGITAPYLNYEIPFYASGDDSYELPPLQLIVNAGLQTSNWTTSDIAVGALDTDFASGSQSLPTGSTLTTRLPTLYSDLANCTALPYNRSGSTVEPLISCVDKYGLLSSTQFGYGITLDEAGYAGSVFPMPGSAGTPETELNCSTIFFIFASEEAVNLIACNYTMTQSTMEVDIVVDSSASYRVSSVNRASEKDVSLIDEFSRLPLIFSGIPTPDSLVDLAYIRNSSAADAFWPDGSPDELFQSGSFDYLFSAITASTSELASLLDEDTLIAAVQSQWSQYFARLGDYYMRIPADNGTYVPGSLVAPQQRMSINPKSARILEGLLAGIFICITVVLLALKTPHVLPKSPYSIASRMSLLAGSELLNLPELKEPGAQRISTVALQKLLSGMRIKLGWWEGEQEGKAMRYGIDLEDVGRQTTLEDYVPVDLQSSGVEVYEMRPKLTQQLEQRLCTKGVKKLGVGL